mmetsp:Transcript_33005/g.80222  ORF Transcript_33005/g.80222 Transcript_33005/m.80222 type:complete len:205 (+) Transcript_33005:722-1336(+)
MLGTPSVRSRTEALASSSAFSIVTASCSRPVFKPAQRFVEPPGVSSSTALFAAFFPSSFIFVGWRTTVALLEYSTIPNVSSGPMQAMMVFTEWPTTSSWVSPLDSRFPSSDWVVASAAIEPEVSITHTMWHGFRPEGLSGASMEVRIRTSVSPFSGSGSDLRIWRTLNASGRCQDEATTRCILDCESVFFLDCEDWELFGVQVV